MVWKRFYSIDIQKFGEFFDFLAAEAVDNAGFARILFYIFYDFPLRVGFISYFILEVRTVE